MPEASCDALDVPEIAADLLATRDGRVLTVSASLAALVPEARTGAQIEPLLGPLPAPGEWRRFRVRGADRVPRTAELSAGAADEDGTRRVHVRLVPGAELLAESQAGLDAAFEHATIGMAFLDVDGRYVRVNPAHAQLLGLEVGELIGIRDMELTHPEDRPADLAAAWRILDGKMDSWTVEKRFLRSDGSCVWAIANLTFLRTPEGLPMMWLGVFQDITGRKAMEARLKREAEEDPLTELPNRRRLDAELTRVLARARREGTAGAVLVIDLDGFKQINDRHGHAAGDRALLQVGAALRARLRATDVVARIGGDEFAVLLPVADAAQAETVACDLVAAIGGVRLSGDVAGELTAAVGISAFGPGAWATGEALLDAADRAMYREKSLGAVAPALTPSRRAPDYASGGDAVDHHEEPLRAEGVDRTGDQRRLRAGADR